MDGSTVWWGDAVAGAIGVPGYGPFHQYNYINLAFFECGQGPVDMGKVWSDAINFFGAGTFGQSTS